MELESPQEESITKALTSFGLDTGTAFWHKYHTDPWVFVLANIVAGLHDQVENLLKLDYPPNDGVPF